VTQASQLAGALPGVHLHWRTDPPDVRLIAGAARVVLQLQIRGQLVRRGL
jgi:hypothetical protein